MADDNDELIRHFSKYFKHEPVEPGLAVTINSVPHRERLVAWLWDGEQGWGELWQDENEVLKLDIYPNPDAKCWTFDYTEFVAVVRQARTELIGEDLSNLE